MEVVYIQNPHPQHYLDLGWSIGHSFVSISPRYHWRCACRQCSAPKLEQTGVLRHISCYRAGRRHFECCGLRTGR